MFLSQSIFPNQYFKMIHFYFVCVLSACLDLLSCFSSVRRHRHMVCGCLADAPNHWLGLHSYVTVFTRDSDRQQGQFCVSMFIGEKKRCSCGPTGCLWCPVKYVVQWKEEKKKRLATGKTLWLREGRLAKQQIYRKRAESESENDAQKSMHGSTTGQQDNLTWRYCYHQHNTWFSSNFSP